MPLSACGAHVKSTVCLDIARLSFISSIEMSAVDSPMRIHVQYLMWSQVLF